MASDFRNIARSPSGRFRSYGGMNDGKLFALWGLREEYKDDTEAVEKIKKVVLARNQAREEEYIYELKKKSGMPPSPMIEMVREQESGPTYAELMKAAKEKASYSNIQALGARSAKILREQESGAAKEKRSAKILFDSKRSAAKSKQVASTEMKPAIMKAARYKGKKNYTGWLMSEKFDGFRAVWDGEKFISKNGNVFYAPKEFTKDFPKVPLDGELWAGREEYQTAASIIKRGTKSKNYNAADWDKLQYVIFDAPGLYSSIDGVEPSKVLNQNKFGGWNGGIRKYMQAEDFDDATKILNEWLDGIAKLPDAKWKTSGYYNLQGTPVDGWVKPKNIKLAKQIKIKDGSPEAIDKEMQKLVEKGAEGIMLRDPKAPYGPGRKSSIIKVKPAWTEEARVLGYEEGLNSNEGKVGSLLVESLQTPGLKFKLGIGLSDEDRVNPPKKGAVVEYKFNGKMKSGKPRHAAFLRVRHDMNRRRSAAVRNINGRRYVGVA